MADIKNWSALGKPSAEWEEAVKASGQPPPDLGVFPTIQSMRDFLEKIIAQKKQNIRPTPGVKEQDHQVTMRDGAKIVCRTYQPENPPAGGSPLAVYYHGGGWCIGGLDDEEPLCRLLTSKFGMTCVNVEYRLGPEHRFPTAVYDCHDATKWAATNATSLLNADPSKGFIIGGTSAGGNLTGVVAHLWRDEKLTPAITGCHYKIPFFIHERHVPDKYRSDYKSWGELESAPILSHKACSLFFDNYKESEDAFKDPLLCPLLFETGHANLPPSYFQICGMDPLRDEALIFERILREEEKIATKVNVYEGMPHGFWAIYDQMPSAATFINESVKGVQWLLKQ